MRNFIKKMMMVIMAVATFLFATPAMAQKAHKGGKISAATRLVIKDRDGGMSFEKAKAFAKEHKSARKQKMTKMPVNGNVPQMETLASTDAYDPIPVAEPASITLSSAGANDVTVTPNGVCEDVREYVYVLTSTLTVGEEYLIVSRNSDGKGYALGHSGTNVAADDVTVKSNTDVADNYYIEESDVDATSKWTVGTGWTFKNGDYYVCRTISYNRQCLAIDTSPDYSWYWENNRLYYRYDNKYYYLTCSSSDFYIIQQLSNIYLYQKVEKKKTAKITAEPTTLTFETAPVTHITKTFNVKGTNLKGDISATFTTNQGNVYSLDASSITVTEAQSGTGKDITVTFSPNEASEYDGTITLSSDGAPSVEVTLKGYSDGYPVVVNQFGVTTLYVDIPLAIPYETYDGKLIGVYVAMGVENNEVRLQRLPKGITANTGVMVIGDPGTYYFLKYRGGDLPRPTTNLLYGSTTDIARNDALTQNGKPNGIVMTLGRNANNIIGFYRYVGSTIRANSAFMIYEPTAGSNVTYFSLGGDSGEETDGISNVKLAKSDDAWYTLQGARLNGQPTQRGIYIHGGKKVAVK